jgi:hypothetical protein
MQRLFSCIPSEAAIFGAGDFHALNRKLVEQLVARQVVSLRQLPLSPESGWEVL